jgi:hypothetical protein
MVRSVARLFGQFPPISAGIGPKKGVFGPISSLTSIREYAQPDGSEGGVLEVKKSAMSLDACGALLLERAPVEEAETVSAQDMR